ncbi:hypothetical protein C1M51_02745 [Methylibium sp. Pch-M]|uniref:hypothetical protein n=1 Tax=Methylibium sp. Pch-M TaxID=2082386 RepID=UPI001011D059|nr:hypothetical protein [Methylibium sp. Pch-M]QAZ38423.1 hypothetical protein C1M51_02745 [Methylibium sp. Pch-M]
MNPKCRQALNSARVATGGKPLTDAQAQAIDDRMAATMRRLAKDDAQAWTATPADQRLLLAAQRVQEDIAAEAARKLENAQRQALKTAETETRLVDSMVRQKGWTRARALVEDYQRTNAYIDGVKRDGTRQLMDLIDASTSQQDASLGRRALMVLFDAENPTMSRDLALEVFAQGKAGTGNAAAQKGAQAWLEVTEGMRQRFNAAGGDVGRLDYGYLPQAHDQPRVLAAGAEKWAADALPLLDRSRYLREDGARMSDAELLDVLRSAHETIATGGANKVAPGASRGTGARANRGSESREIHFEDGEAYLAYLKRYGTGSMYDAMIGHIGGLSRDIGLVERYGPNPEAQMRLQFDLYERADGVRGSLLGQIAENMAGPEAQWSVLSGASGQAQYARIAQFGQNVRNIETTGKLQWAVLSSLTDTGTYFVTTGYNKLGYWQGLRSLGRAASADTREFMNAHGFIAESMVSDLNRWSGEHIANNWSGRIASSTMKLSLMNAWTDTLRRAFSLTMMQGLARLSKTEWGALTEYDRWRMSSKGLTEADWDLMRRAEMAQHRGVDFITPDAIYATGDPRAGEVVAKMIGMITDESEIAILNPDLTTRAITSGGGAQRGTMGGELARSTAQFKSFPIAMISRHWRRMIDTPQGLEGAPLMANRLVYAAAMMTSLTVLGAIAFQTKQLVAGKDPVDMTTPKFWTRAVAQGGGLGFVGDMLLTDTADDRSPLDTFGKSFLGPGFGSAAELYELTKGNIDEMNAGKVTHFGAEAFRFGRSHAPLVNLWWGKAALDHAVLNSVQENLSPGYLARVRNRAQKDWRQGYWWEPQDTAPDRAPDLGAIAP